MMGDPVFDAFYSSNVEFVSSTVVQETSMQAAGAALLDKIGPAILISHSHGGLFPWLWADIRPTLVKAIVQAGVPVEHLNLPDVGIYGNVHMHSMEKNSDDIAADLEKWIRKTIESGKRPRRRDIVANRGDNL